MIYFMHFLAIAFAFAPASSSEHAGLKRSMSEPIVHYFPRPESQGGWRKLDDPDDIRELAGMDPAKLDELKDWLLKSDNRDFAAVVIRNGYIVLEMERGNSSKTDARRVASVSKAICATVLAIASEQSQKGKTPEKMSFDDPAFEFIPWASPLSDPRKAKITIKQLLNHTSGICPEATGARNDGTWEYILGHSGDERTAKLAFDPGTACGYSTHALAHAALVCETVTGKPYDQFAIEALFKPIGCEHWWFQYYDGGSDIGRHPSHGMGMPARDLARIGYCMLRNGKWNEEQVIPGWFVEQTSQPTHDLKTPELRFRIPAQTFSHGWELPARLTGEGGTPSGKDIPADARYKPGSGGQLIAFVPSLDLVVTRQTGSSGEWEYAEYLRRACAAVLDNQPDGKAGSNESGIAQEEDMVENSHTNQQFDWQTATPESQGMSIQKLDALRDSLAAKNTKSLLIIRNDRIVYEWYAPGHSADKTHYTASMAKALVGGVCLAVAMGDGRIGLDNKASEYIPQWVDDPVKSKITVRHLGSHTSGIEDAEADDLPHEELTGWKGDFWKRLDVPNDPFSISRDKAPVLFEPGAKFQYSNPGIAMLSYVITAALRDAPEKDLRTLLRERIMNHIGVSDREWSVGYGQVFAVDDLPLVAAWGGGGYTARALARVGRLMLRRGDWEGARLISEDAVRLTTSSAGLPGENGMGWWTNADGRFALLPKDAFWASGAGHQTLLVVPGLNLICVRNGGPLNVKKEEYREVRGPYLFEPLMSAITDAVSDSGEETTLSASPSGHYVQYSGKVLMLVGDSGTQCVTQNLNLDYRQWIDDCAARGVTAVHVWALVPPRQKRDGSIIEERYGYVYPGATPWARRPDGPLANDGWPQWDLTRFDEGDDPSKHYWPLMRDLCSYAKQHGIIVGITVFFGWPKHNRPSRPDWSYHPFNVINGGFLSDPESITTVAQTIHSPGKEVLHESWSENWPPEKKNQWVWERYADKMIQETNGYGNVFYVFMDEHSYPEGNCGDHFLEFFRKRGAVYVDWDKRRDVVDFVHDDARNPEGDGNSGAVKAFAKVPTRPNIALEVPPYQGEIVRLSIWSRLVGGLHYFFHNDSGQETVQTGIMIYDPNVEGGREDRVMERLNWLGNASRFFNDTVRDLDSMTPHNDLVSSGKQTYCLANPGFEYAVYSWSEKSFELDLSAAAGKNMVARFYNPVNGQWKDAMHIEGGSVKTFEKPDEKDWLLYLLQEE